MVKHIIMKWTEITFWVFVGAFMVMPFSVTPEEMIISMIFCFVSALLVSFTMYLIPNMIYHIGKWLLF